MDNFKHTEMITYFYLKNLRELLEYATNKNKTKEDYLNQIIEYYYHSILYSSDNVILSLKKFIQEPNKDNYIKTAKAMREELWENKTKLKYEDILINHNL